MYLIKTFAGSALKKKIKEKYYFKANLKPIEIKALRLKFKALKNTFKTVKKYCYFFLFDSQLTGLIQNTAISKHFTKPVVYQWNYFQRGCIYR